MQAIVSLIARETGEGISLPPAEGLEKGPQDSNVTPSTSDGEDKPSGGSHLKILK
jgi:stringent starvation protein B